MSRLAVLTQDTPTLTSCKPVSIRFRISVKSLERKRRDLRREEQCSMSVSALYMMIEKIDTCL